MKYQELLQVLQKHPDAPRAINVWNQRARTCATSLEISGWEGMHLCFKCILCFRVAVCVQIIFVPVT